MRVEQARGTSVGFDRRICHRFASTERSVLILLSEIRCQPFGKGFRFLLDATTPRRSEGVEARGFQTFTRGAIVSSVKRRQCTGEYETPLLLLLTMTMLPVMMPNRLLLWLYFAFVLVVGRKYGLSLIHRRRVFSPPEVVVVLCLLRRSFH